MASAATPSALPVLSETARGGGPSLPTRRRGCTAKATCCEWIQRPGREPQRATAALYLYLVLSGCATFTPRRRPSTGWPPRRGRRRSRATAQRVAGWRLWVAVYSTPFGHAGSSRPDVRLCQLGAHRHERVAAHHRVRVEGGGSASAGHRGVHARQCEREQCRRREATLVLWNGRGLDKQQALPPRRDQIQGETHAAGKSHLPWRIEHHLCAAGHQVARLQGNHRPLHGVPEYARRLAGLRRDATAQSSGIARRIALINSHYHRWHDPLVLRPSLLRQPRYAWMLEMRLRGGHDKDDAATRSSEDSPCSSTTCSVPAWWTHRTRRSTARAMGSGGMVLGGCGGTRGVIHTRRFLKASIYKRSAYTPTYTRSSPTRSAHASRNAERMQLCGFDGVDREGLVVLLSFCVKVEKLRLHHVEQRVVALHPCDGQLPSGALLAQHHKVGPSRPGARHGQLELTKVRVR